MFCKKCGTEIAPGGAFCPACGTPVDSPAVDPAPVADPTPAIDPTPAVDPAPPVDPVPVIDPAPAVNPVPVAPPAAAPVQPQSSPKGFLIPVIACVVVLILLIAGIASCAGGSPKSVAKKYYTNYLNCNFKASLNSSIFDEKIVEKILKEEAKENDTSMKELYEMMGKAFDAKVNSVSDIVKLASKKAKEANIDQYGKYKVSVEVRNAKKMDDNDLETLRDAIDESDTISKYLQGKKIKAGYEVKLKYRIDGKDDDKSGTVTLQIVKYGGKWKVFSDSILDQIF